MEKLVKEKIKEACNLDDCDIRTTVGSENGADIKLSNKAKARFPFSIECKKRAKMETLYKFYDQAKAHDPKLCPLVILQADYKEPLVLLSLEHFLSFAVK